MFALIERLIFFLFVITAIRSALLFLQRLWTGFQPRGGTASAPRPIDPSAAGKSQTMTLYQDPVCGTYVSVDTSLKRIVGDRVLHFCSPACRDRFVA